jgi:NADP-dependent 3-hydroxy acid dehydrogenase YdfG
VLAADLTDATSAHDAVDARSRSSVGEVEQLHAEDIANAVAYIVTNPRRVAVNEIVIRPTDQP